MTSSHEIEIKFRVTDLNVLIAHLRELHFEQITPRTHEMNVLFDLPDHPLRNRGELLRLRKYGDTWVITHKARAQNDGGRHKSRLETETQVKDGEKMGAVLRALRFEPRFRYEKFRAEWKGQRGHVVIDETPIGNFAEIEGPPEWIDSIAKELGIAPGDYITDTYAGLFLEWKRRTCSPANEMTFEAVSQSKS